MNKLSLLIVLTISLIFTAQDLYAAEPIGNLLDVPVPSRLDGTNLTLEEVQYAILWGCRRRGWSARVEESGLIVASITVRSAHHAEIEIQFSAVSYSVLYKDSSGLDYNAKRNKIHRNYNKWVVMLSASIQRGFGVRAQGY